ncbi:MAG: hypothetical protein GY943_16380 [Chloroflexi bacterium]|nr:hypothetical protein [Chloroflexota bacterium]
MEWLSVIRKTEDRTWERLSAALKENWFDGAAVANAISDPAPYLIELITNNQNDEQSRRKINKIVNS